MRLGRRENPHDLYMYYTYILFSEKLNKFYIGSTSDLRTRLKDHNDGKSVFTSQGKPWKLVYYEAFCEKQDALNEEKFLKTGQGREKRKYLLNIYLSKLNN